MISLPILTPELEQHFVDIRPDYWDAIGKAIASATSRRQNGINEAHHASPAGIVNERSFAPKGQNGWPGRLTLGEFRVPSDTIAPVTYDQVNARYLQVVDEGWLFIPNWFPEDPPRNPRV